MSQTGLTPLNNKNNPQGEGGYGRVYRGDPPPKGGKGGVLSDMFTGEGYNQHLAPPPCPTPSLNHKTKARITIDTAKCGGKKYGGLFFF